MTTTTNTETDKNLPSTVFAKLTQDLDELTIANEDNIKIYVIDPFNVELDLFRKAFYANGSSNLKYYVPPTVPTNLLENAKLKNLLALSSGGGSYTDTATPPVITPLGKKTITFTDRMNPSPEDFIFNTFIIQDINDASQIDFTNWSFDSQIDLARKLADYQYIYKFQIILNDSSDGIIKKNTNALTWSELQQTVNTYVYKYYNEKDEEPPVDANGKLSVILSFVASFKAKIDDGSSTTTPVTTDTRVLYQYKITDWPYEVVVF